MLDELFGFGVESADTGVIGEYFVICSYDLIGLETPPLGPYGSPEVAVRARDEIFAAVTGNCA